MFHLSTARKNLDVCEATEEGQSSTGLGHKSKSKNSEEIFQCCLFLFLKFATSLSYGNAQLFWTNQFSRVNSAMTEIQTIMRRSLSFITVELTPRAGHCHHAELGALHLGHTEMLHGDPALMGNPGIAGVGKQSFSLTPMGQVASQSDGDTNRSAKQACTQRLPPPPKCKGQRLYTDSKCAHGEGKEHSNSRCQNKTRGTARGTPCVLSTSQMERSAKMGGLVSR